MRPRQFPLGPLNMIGNDRIARRIVGAILAERLEGMLVARVPERDGEIAAKTAHAGACHGRVADELGKLVVAAAPENNQVSNVQILP